MNSTQLQNHSLVKNLNYSYDSKLYLLHNDIYYEFLFGDIRTNLLLKKSADNQLCMFCGDDSLNFSKAAKKQILKHLTEFHDFKIFDELPDDKNTIKIDPYQTFSIINNSIELNQSVENNNLNTKSLPAISNKNDKSSNSVFEQNSVFKQDSINLLENGLANDQNNNLINDSSNRNETACNLLIMNDKLNINSSIKLPKKQPNRNQSNKNSSKKQIGLTNNPIDLTNSPIDLSTNNNANLLENKILISLEEIENKKSARKIANQANSKNDNQSIKNQTKRKTKSDQTRNRTKKAKPNPKSIIQTDDNEINLLNYNRFIASDSSNLLNSQIYQNTFGIELQTENNIYNPLLNSLLLNCLNNSNDLFNLNDRKDNHNSINNFSSFINSLNNEKANNQQVDKSNGYAQHDNQLIKNQETICLDNVQSNENANDYFVKDEFDEKILSLEVKLTNIEKNLINISNDYRSTKNELLELVNDRNNLKNKFRNQQSIN